MNQENFNKHFYKEIDDIIDKVYAKAINYENNIKSNNIDNSMLVASEFLFVLFFALDLLLFDNFGSRGRNSMMDAIVPNVLRRYVSNFIKDKTIFLEFYEKLESSYNQRLLVYSKCELNFKGLMPGKGTVAFAMSYYMHQLMNKKPLNNEFDILTGNSDINQNDMESLPEITEVMKNHIELITSIMESQIDKHVRNINGLFEK